VPLLSSTLTVLLLLMVTRSGALSPFKSVASPRPTEDVMVKLTGGLKVASPLPSNTAICPGKRGCEPVISSLVSPSKSATKMLPTSPLALHIARYLLLIGIACCLLSITNAL
jgi:hypothetical protein